MNTQVNLLPEARVLKLKAQARKRFATTLTIVVSVVVGTVLITLLLLLGYTYSTQRLNQAKINSLKAEVGKFADLELKASTLQEHLAGFATLQANRLYVSEIFKSLSNIIPSGVKVTSFQISNSNVITISGTAQNIAQVSMFAQALQDYNVDYKPQQGLDRKPLFSSVNITAINKDVTSGQVNFSMTFVVDPSLFEKTKPTGGTQ